MGGPRAARPFPPHPVRGMISLTMQAQTMLAMMLLTFSASGQSTPNGADKGTELSRHIHLSQQYLAQHEPIKAIPELQAVLALDPKNLEAHANLGVLLFFQGEFVAAIPQLREALKLKPDLPKIESLLGLAERRIGDDLSGRRDLEAAFPRIEEEKLRLDVGRDLIESYSAAGELDKAADTVAVLLKTKPTDANLLYTSYRIHNDMAVEALLELALAAPESGQLHQAMAHELQRERDLAGTTNNLRKALALDSSLPGIHFELAEALHASDDQRLRAESLEQYRLAVQTAPNDPKAASRLGDIELEHGDADAAMSSYQQALKIQPNYVDAEVGLANILSEKGDSAAAAKLLEQVEAADPSNSLAHYRLSVVYRKLKRPDDVKRELELYQRYKNEREKLKAVYQNMRQAGPSDEPPK
jgi:Tfp pilus assembly protein PilF